MIATPPRTLRIGDISPAEDDERPVKNSVEIFRKQVENVVENDNLRSNDSLVL